MGNIYITDMTHFAGIPADSEYAAARKVADFFGSIVSVASISPAGELIESALFCRRRPNRVPCAGHLQVQRDKVTDLITWHCSQCDDQGQISNWKSSIWDLSQFKENCSAKQKILRLNLTRDEFHELTTIPIPVSLYKVLLFQTTIIKGEYILKATLEELDFLQQQIACVISVEIKPDRRRILGEIYERMDILLEEEDQRDPKLFEEANLEAMARLKELGFHCQGCGNCCRGLGFELTLEHYETRRWRNFSKVVPSTYGYYYPSDFMSIIAAADCADLWFHPETEEELFRCPFLKKVRSQNRYQCLIYDLPELRPGACKSFPMKDGKFMAEMINICPELKRLKQKGSM